jgi:hypothetical protein
MKNRLQNLPTGSTIIITLLCVFLLYVLCVVTVRMWGGLADWSMYRRVILCWLRGHNPYDLPGRFQFYNPPWVLPLLLPFYLLPVHYGAAALVFVTLVGVTYTSYRMGGRLWGTALLLTSPPIVACLVCGQLDWLTLLGLVLPPQYGIFLTVIKPQVGIVVALYWFTEIWHVQGLRKAVFTFIPVVSGFLLSFAWYGLWPLHWFTLSQWEDQLPLTFWPFGIPIGLYLVYRTIQQRDLKTALYAAPFLSSHVRVYSWAGCFLTLVTEPKLLALVSISSWIVLLVCQIEV